MIHPPHPYPAYKPSGVEWLGDVPTHWELVPSRAVFTEINERDHPDEQMLSVTIARGVIRQKILLQDSSQKDSSRLDKSAYKLVCPGDLAYNKMRAWQGAFGVSTYRGIVSPAYVVQRPRNGANALYFHHLLRTPAFAAEAERWSYGIASDMWSLRPEHFKMMYVPLPPLPEQAAIVRYLDHANRRIRRYVSSKRKLIALLEEEKQAIVNRAVTRGLDPNVRLKPSGVEWLGYVPEHWQVSALRHRYRQCLGKMLDSKRITGRNSLPYLRNTDIQWDRINIEGLPTMDISPDEYSRYTVQQGDLLVCEGGEVGRCALWTSEETRFGFQKALHRLRPRNTRHDVPRFMYYTLRAAAKGNAFNDGHLSTIAHLTGDKLRAHRFPFPPLAEQESLVNFLDSVTKRIDQGISATLRQIDLLREYRTRLIADVVTGKLDVREAAAQLPDESDDEEPIDEGGALSDDADGDLYDAGNFKEELAMESEVTA